MYFAKIIYLFLIINVCAAAAFNLTDEIKSYEPSLNAALSNINRINQLADTANQQSLDKRSMVADNEPKIYKTFQSMEDLLNSAYFKNEGRLKNVVTQIEGRDNYYEIKPTGKENDVGILVVETNLGDPKMASKLDQPITACEFAKSPHISAVSSLGASFSEQFTHKTSLHLDGVYNNELVGVLLAALSYLGYPVPIPTPLVNLSVSIGGAVDFGFERSSSRTFGGSISCESGPGGAVQVFSSLRYVYYPKAKSRVLLYKQGASPELKETGPWEPTYSSDDYPQYGVIFYDNANGMDYACVNDRQFLQCDAEIPLKVYTPEFDPAVGLHRAITSQ